MCPVLILYLLAIIIGFETIIIAQKKFCTLLNHYTLTNIYWICIIFASIFMNDYQISVSGEVYLIFIGGLIAYDVTILFVKKDKPINMYIPLLDINRRRMIEIVLLLNLIPTAYINYKLILSGVELWQINFDYWEFHKSGSNYWLLEFQQVFLSPLSLFVIGTSFYSLYQKYSYKSFFITITIACIVTLCYLLISGGGRSQVMIMMYVILLSFMASRTNALKEYLYKPHSYLIVFILVLGVLALGWANVGRGKNDNFLQEAINGQIIYAPLFEHYLHNTKVFSEFTFGASMFEPLINLLRYPFKLLINLDFNTYVNNNDIIQRFTYLPAYGREYNAQVSAYWYYMRDFGYWGVIIGPMITAGIYNLLYQFCRKNSFYQCYYTCFILSGCFNTTYPFGKIFWVSIIIMIILSRFMKIKGNLNNNYSY